MVWMIYLKGHDSVVMTVETYRAIYEERQGEMLRESFNELNLPQVRG